MLFSFLHFFVFYVMEPPVQQILLTRPYEWHHLHNAFLFLRSHRLNLPVFSVSVLLFHASVLPFFPAPDTLPDRTDWSVSVLLHPAILWFGFQADGLVRHPRVHQTADRHTDRFPLPLLSVSVSLSGVIRNEKMHIWSPCWSVLPENDVFSGGRSFLKKKKIVKHLYRGSF